MQFNLVKYRGAGFPVHQGPWWSGLLSGRRSYVYMHRGLTYCRSCGLSVLAIWNHVGEKCCEAFVFFSFKPFLSVLVFLYFPASRPLPSSFFFFFFFFTVFTVWQVLECPYLRHPRHPPSTQLDAVVDCLYHIIIFQFLCQSESPTTQSSVHPSFSDCYNLILERSHHRSTVSPCHFILQS